MDPFGLPRAQDEEQDPFASFGQSAAVEVPLDSPDVKNSPFASHDVMTSPFDTEGVAFGQSLEVKNELFSEDLVQDDFQNQEKGHVSLGKCKVLVILVMDNAVQVLMFCIGVSK